MHESQLARRVLEVVLARARDAGAGSVRRVQGRLGEMEALSEDALAFHFRALARGTEAEHAELAIRLQHVAARCRACDRVYLPDHVLLCPACASTDGELLGEIGLLIETLEIEDAK
jgi:hydrogenase nickel incorporation protein HypA/HybF